MTATGACGCCAGVAERTPLDRAEPARPVRDRVPDRDARGLPRLDDRGAHRRRRSTRLAELSTRDPGDFSIALLDAWAVAADVLDLLHRAARAGVLSPHGPRPDLAAGARAPDRLPAPPGRRGRDARRVRARAAAGRAGRSAATRAPLPPVTRRPSRSRRGCASRASPARASGRRPSRPSRRSRRARSGTRFPPRRRSRSCPASARTHAYLAGRCAQPQAGRRAPAQGGRRARRALGPADADERPARAVGRPATGADARRVGRAARLASTRSSARTPSEVYVLRKRLNVFGHNAPLWKSMSDDFRADYWSSELPQPGDWPRFDDLARRGLRGRPRRVAARRRRRLLGRALEARATASCGACSR